MSTYFFRCCHAREARLASCTDPLSIENDAEQEDFCPSPPLLSATDLMNSDLSGRLDSDNTYVAEHLMREAEDEDTVSDFYRQYQAGYVITSARDPAFSICGCTSVNDTCQHFNLLEPAAVNSTQCPYPYYELINISAPAPPMTCPDSFTGCYNVDGYVANGVEGLACSFSGNLSTCDDGMRSVSATFPDHDDRVTVTVWYSNQVRYM